jgi:hypothetical protein
MSDYPEYNTPEAKHLFIVGDGLKATQARIEEARQNTTDEAKLARLTAAQQRLDIHWAQYQEDLHRLIETTLL